MLALKMERATMCYELREVTGDSSTTTKLGVCINHNKTRGVYYDGEKEAYA